MDQYLYFNNNHPLEHKRGLLKNLMHRVDTIMSDEKDKVKEKSHVKQALNMNGYLDWLINSTPSREPSLESATDRSKTTKTPTSKELPVVLSYINGVSEQIKKIFKQYDIPAYFKPLHALRQLLVRLKDKILKEGVVGPVYHIPCQ